MVVSSNWKAFVGYHRSTLQMPKKVCNLFEMLNSKLKLVCNLFTVNSPRIYCWKISVIFIYLKLIYKWNHAQCWLSSFAGCFVAWQLSWKIFIALICQILSGFAIFYCPMLFFACVTKLFVIPLACSQLLTSACGACGCWRWQSRWR